MIKQSSAVFTLSIIILIQLLACSNAGTGIREISNPAGDESQLPYLYTDNTGKTFFSWVEPGSGKEETELYYSVWNGSKWAAPSKIASSSNWFVNWADFPSVIAQDGKPLASHRLFKIPGSTYSYNVQINMAKEEDSWSPPVIPHFDSTATEHGFVSMVPGGNRNVLAIWLDGRRTHNRSANEYFDIDKAMTLRSALVTENGDVTDKKLIDESVCDCCQTSMTVTSEGPVAAYRDRTGNEVRDIYTTRYIDGSWTPPAPVYNDNWKIAACPVNGPKISYADSLTAVAWYTGAGDKQTVKVAFSDDFGASFGQPIIIDEGKVSGRVDLVITNSNTAYVSWIGQKQGMGQLMVQKFVSGEKAGSPVVVSEIKTSRKSGFPQMEISREGLLFAWTHIDNEDIPTIKTALLPLGVR